MAGSPDFSELLRLLNKHKVDYLVVGGYAVMMYGEPRFTKDLDLTPHSGARGSSAVKRSPKATIAAQREPCDRQKALQMGLGVD